MAVPFLHLGPLRADGIFPEAVEIRPGFAHHLRARVFGQGVGGVDLGCPIGSERVVGDFPVRSYKRGDAHKRQGNGDSHSTVRYSISRTRRCGLLSFV